MGHLGSRGGIGARGETGDKGDTGGVSHQHVVRYMYKVLKGYVELLVSKVLVQGPVGSTGG